MIQGFFLYVLALSLATLGIYSIGQRRSIWRPISSWGRQDSAVRTDQKQQSSLDKAAANARLKDPQYAIIWPPSTRSVLPEIAASLPEGQRKALGDLEFDERSLARDIIGFEEDYRTSKDFKYTCTGFSMKEIRALGNFPDYATLTGVPLPKPYLGFDIDKALPRPYRPVRWTYHQTMSMHRLEPDWWLELERSYKSRMARRHAVRSAYPEDTFRFLPGSELACKEVMEIALQFVCTRYPQYFNLDAEKKVLENKILGTKQNIYDKHPLLILSDNIPEDFMVMMRNPATGMYHLRAALICLGIGFNAASVIGKELREIHSPVPDCKAKMQFSMDRYFATVPTQKGMSRGSWGVDLDQRVYEQKDMKEFQDRFVQEPGLDPARIHWRVDWQTLRRLPLSGACVFNFKSVFAPISELRDEPYVPSLVLKVIKEGKKELIDYKGTFHTEHVLLPLLEEYEREQVEKGLIERDWEAGTLPESPFYRGWEEKWHAQQGF